LLDKGVTDPRAFWMRLFTSTGVAFSPDGEGIRLL